MSLDSNGRRRSGSAPHMHRTLTNNTVIQRNEADAMKSQERHEKGGKEEADSRMLTTVRSPSADRDGRQGQTLPVVEELGEASSTGGRSGRSRERDERPITPAKDERPLTPAKNSPKLSANGSPGGKTISRSSLDKELPPLPQVQSPGELNETESIVR
jgi:1-phosphatidylinositol-4-phosphate 5-kinase